MTQQLDLTFNTTNTMDKMMTSSSFNSGNDSKTSAEFDSQFSSYLDNANKSLNNNDNKYNNTSYKENTTNYNDKNTKSETKTSYSDDKKQTFENNESKVSSDDTKSYDKEAVKEEASEKTTEYDKNEQSSKDMQVVEDVLDEQQMDEMLKNSMLNASLTENKVVSKEDVATLEKALAMSKEDSSELSIDAIKSGVQFEDVLSNTTEDLTEVDVKAVDTIAENVTASVDESIKSMYKSDDKVAMNLDQNDAKKLVMYSLKSDLHEKTVDVKNADVKTEALDTLKVDAKVDLKADVKAEAVELVKNEEAEIPQMTVENDVKIKDETSELGLKVNSEDLKISNDVKADVKTVNLDENLSKMEVKEEKTSDDVKDLKSENLNLDAKEEILKNVEEVKVSDVDETIALNTLKAEKVDTSEKAVNLKETTSADKLQTLNEEISSAKLENTANMAQKTDKTVADENAKTNVKADETMNIKEDVSGIEFKNVETSEKTVDEKAVTANADKVKNRVENVKIQVEDDLKVSPQQQNLTDAEKVAKANETMEKAGLSTENLKKMDGKIKDIDYSSNQNPQTDLGQSSQEMMMRDSMQNANQTLTQGTSETTKVDFAQALSKSAHANNQQAQAQQDAQDVDILEQIRSRLNVSAKNGLQKITIGLTPESLGKLNIEISRGQNGISAQILADNPQAKEILEKNLDGLKSVLQSQGVNVNNVNVKVAEAGRSSENNNNMFQNNDGQPESNHREGHSGNSDDSNKDKRSEFEFIKNTVLTKESLEDTDDVVTRTTQMEKTVSINGGLGKVSYKL